MAYSTNNKLPGEQSPEDQSDFNYRAGLRKRYRTKLDSVGDTYDDATKAGENFLRRQTAESLAATGSRNLGALGDVTSQNRKMAADYFKSMALDKSQAELGALETLQEMDTAGSLGAKTNTDYQTLISNYANEIAGVWNEQEETADYIRDTLIVDAKKRKDTESLAMLEKEERRIRGTDMRSGETYRDV